MKDLTLQDIIDRLDDELQEQDQENLEMIADLIEWGD